MKLRIKAFNNRAKALYENHSHFHWSRNKKQVNEDVSKDEELLDQLESDIQALNQ